MQGKYITSCFWEFTITECTEIEKETFLDSNGDFVYLLIVETRDEQDRLTIAGCFEIPTELKYNAAQLRTRPYLRRAQLVQKRGICESIHSIKRSNCDFSEYGRTPDQYLIL